MTIPVDSLTFKPSALASPSPASVQSNLCRRLANASSIVATANVVPGQLLLPQPNGINSKSRPLKSMLGFKNLSGLNSSGSSNNPGSLPIARAFIITPDFAGMSYPPTLTSFVGCRGSNNGSGGCNLSVSFITAFR
ncbi:RNA polymerase, subunit H/Rpb5, conserved site-containing protein [Melia azedarach]|uniref:RNA polymerase, subunit H/Rpb5, conserved site-containing protein n=1 Tax=Melia azedarach TaxID=155640 RepID=A0ACC1XLY2_MELAZ|nr:RNA polymerase, subunit H/Rpb5, conserved site-containing protein [Melia azedarach]